MRPHTKKKIGFVTLATVAISSSLAYAFWTGSGTGTGTAATGKGELALTVNQTSIISGLGPDDVAQVLSGNFTNPNAGPVYVGAVTASIASVTKAPGAVDGTCDETDYTLSGAKMVLNREIPAGANKGVWSGATIQFNNKGVNQDACKGATVNLAYTITAA